MIPERPTDDLLLGPRLLAARVAWAVLVALCLWLWGLTSVQYLSEPRRLAAETTDPTVFTLEDVGVLRSLGLPEALATVLELFFLALGVAYFIVGALIFWRRSDRWVALLTSFTLVFLGALIFSYAFEVLSREQTLWSLLLSGLIFPGMVSLSLLLYAFPDGRFVPGWTRLLPIPLGALFLLFFLPLPAAVQQAASVAAVLGLVGTGAYARLYRYRRFSTLVQRQQTKWVGVGLMGIVAMMTLWFMAQLAFLPSEPGPARIYYLMALLPFGGVVGILFPLAVGIAILRHRLWDIDILINRTVVYGPLTGVLMGLYVGSIRLFQALFVRFTGEQSDLSLLLSTLVLAGAFMPLRLRLQTLADRYVRENPDPARGLRAFGDQMRSLAQFADVGHITRRLLDETMAAFHAESGAVFLREGSELRLAQTAGDWTGRAEIRVPLERAGTQVGELALGPRHKGQKYTLPDEETLRGIAEAATQALAFSTRAL